MPPLERKVTHKVVKVDYTALAESHQHRLTHETAVRQPFLDLLRATARPRSPTVKAEFPVSGTHGGLIIVDAPMRNGLFSRHQSRDECLATLRHQIRGRTERS